MSDEKKTILVVDDEELNRTILEIILQEEYRVVLAANGLEAYRVLVEEKGNVSLILLDIVMPVMDGFDFLTRLQRSESYSNIPIIFVSAATYAENVLEGIKLGVRDVIAKPFEPDEVMNRVEKLIALTESREQMRKTVPAETAVAAPIRPQRNTVLIVDDIPLNRVILQTALEEKYRILEAEDGKKALELLEQYNDEIAVMLLDIIMPVMDGYEVMKRASRHKLLDQIPVIAITAEHSLPKQGKMRDLGISEVIDKPFAPEIVLARVDHLAELSNSSSGLPGTS